MAFDFYLTENDIGPSMQSVLKDEADEPYNLTGIAVSFNGRKPDGTAFTKSVTITDQEAGVVQVDWEASDTALSGVMKFQFELDNGETVPNDRHYKVYIHPEV
jgi:uncharacterized protein YfaS (alpha-2-macroglobulin family)